MMTKWIYNPDRAIISAIDSGNCSIEIVDVYGGTEKERDEHGYLIAAAPDLLAACKNSLDLLCTGYENGIAKIYISNAGELISQLKNAIERAQNEITN